MQIRLAFFVEGDFYFYLQNSDRKQQQQQQRRQPQSVSSLIRSIPHIRGGMFSKGLLDLEV